ncbi:MAG TPA: hypothetical protein PKI19_08050, partial [Elusimicrobiales bacterium]|nr:hypothetical protein [Elusimicrobiales bacterium]
MKNLILGSLLAAGLAAAASAADLPPGVPPPSAPGNAAVRDPLAGDGNPFSDPVFQDFVETSDGYLNAKNAPKKEGDLRDALAAPRLPTLRNPVPAALPSIVKGERLEPAGAPLNYYKVTFAGETGPMGSHVWPLDSTPGRYAREYVFLNITPVTPDYDQLLFSLEKETGFRFAGEKTSFSRNAKKTVILGWAPYYSLPKIMKVKGVAAASVERKSAGMPLKTKVRITLKVPFQNKPNAFVPEFIRTLGKNNNFDAEAWFRLPSKSADSKFSVFNVTGTL